jgi:hypothetical protein
LKEEVMISIQLHMAKGILAVRITGQPVIVGGE